MEGNHHIRELNDAGRERDHLAGESIRATPPIPSFEHLH
jgi:hypothetical protein